MERGTYSLLLITHIGKATYRYLLMNQTSLFLQTVATQGKILLEHRSSFDSDVPELELWRQMSKLFVKTDVVKDILGILHVSKCLLLTGVSGMGKTLTAQCIALQLSREMRYGIEPCINITDIKKRYKKNVHQVFLLDDICGKYTANINDIENWIRIQEFVKSILDNNNTMILATCRTEVFHEENLKDIFHLFNNSVYDLTEKYSRKDKLKIASKYLKKDDQMLKEIIKMVEFTPLMCFLYSHHEDIDIDEFLNCPYDTFCKDWNTLRCFDKVKFCVLLLCVIYNGTVTDSILDVSNDLDKQEKRKLKTIFEYCKLGRDTSRSAIKDKMNACIDTYFIKVDRGYKVIHDKMFDFLCCYFSKTLLTPILKFADDKLVCERVQLESIKKEHGLFTMIVLENDEHVYNTRLTTDLRSGKMHCCLNNTQMKYKEYRTKFLEIFKTFDDELKKLLIDAKDDTGIDSFTISCLRGYDELVEYFISVGADINVQIGWFTPLTAACRDGHVKTVDILIDKGSKVNETNINGETPLYIACFGGHCSLVKRLIEKHADINKENKYNHTPLYASCLMGHSNIVGILIEKGANISDCKDSIIVTCLGGHDKIVEKLIFKGCNVNINDLKGKTPLLIACEQGYTKIVNLLIKNNADILMVDDNGKTPLHAACYIGNDEIVKVLIKNYADVNMSDFNLETPLHNACKNGSLDVIYTLLANGADIHKANRDGRYPAYFAKTTGNIVDLSILKDLGVKELVSIERQNISDCKKFELRKFSSNGKLLGWTPLFEACENWDNETVKLLIRNKATVNMQTGTGELPLVVACQQGNGILLQMLIDEGADINQALYNAVQNDYERAVNILLYKRALYNAIKYEYDRSVQILLYKRRDIHDIGDEGQDGKLLMKLACKQGSVKAIKILLNRGANATEIYENGQTLLHFACYKDRFDLFKMLTDNGLDPNISDKNGRYPLFVSMLEGSYDITEYLIKKDSCIALLEEDKKKAVISVFESGKKELSKLLVSKGYTDTLPAFDDIMFYHGCRLDLCDTVKILHRCCKVKTYKYGYTPMILADIAGNDDLSDYLLSPQYFFSSEESNNHYTGIYKKLRSYQIFMSRVIYVDRSFNHVNRDYEYLFQACINGLINSLLSETMLAKLDLNIFFNTNTSVIWFPQTPLCLASRRGQTDLVKLLLKFDALVDLTFEENIQRGDDDDTLSMTIRYGYTPLFAAYQRKNHEIVDMLLKSGANLNKALFDACLEGYIDTAQFLLEKGADVNSFGRHGRTALYAAYSSGYYTIVKYLIEQGAVVDKHVVKAIISGKLTCFHGTQLTLGHKINNLLISKGASVFTIDVVGRTLLHTACKEGMYEIVKILIKKGAEVNARDIYDTTPLIACVLQNRDDYLLRRSYRYRTSPISKEFSDVFKNRFGCYCVRDDDIENDIIKVENFDISAIYVSQQSDLKCQELTKPHYKVIQLLLEKGAKIDSADWKGRTPLFLASEIGDLKLVKLLIEKGADMNMRTTNRETPILVARIFKNVDVINYLHSREYHNIPSVP